MKIADPRGPTALPLVFILASTTDPLPLNPFLSLIHYFLTIFPVCLTWHLIRPVSLEGTATSA